MLILTPTDDLPVSRMERLPFVDPSIPLIEPEFGLREAPWLERAASRLVHLSQLHCLVNIKSSATHLQGRDLGLAGGAVATGIGWSVTRNSARGGSFVVGINCR